MGCFILWPPDHLRPWVCRTGRCKLPRWVVYKWHLSAPRSALLAKQQPTCHGWQTPDGKGKTLPESRSDIAKARPFPSGWCHPLRKGTLPVQPHLPSSLPAPKNQGADRNDPSPARFAPASPGQVHPSRSVRTVDDDAGQMQHLPVYRLTFASIPDGRVRPEDDELSVHPATRLLTQGRATFRLWFSLTTPSTRPGRASGR